VTIDAALNRATGVVTWTFHSLDPATGDFPDNPLAGFLPPDDSTGRGEAFVDYVIRPKANLPTGTIINQQASVVFDTNAPIETKVFTNTIDADPPTSRVNALPVVANSNAVTVSWSGADPGGSGVASYDVYVSTNGGPFQLWLKDTAATSALFTGNLGSNYGFYSVATDNVGHVQPSVSAAQATTRLPNPVMDVTRQVSVQATSVRHVGRLLMVTLAIRNMSRQSFDGPVSVVFDGLPAGVAVQKPAGRTAKFAPRRSPYVNVSVGADNQLTPKELRTVRVILTAPGTMTPRFRFRALAGFGAR
jgi:hypothetical protein